MITFNLALTIIATFLWIGFVGAISFMEAWLKFRAPGVTLPIGLGIGRLVFKALNKVEIVFAFSISICILSTESTFVTIEKIIFFIPLLILLIQTFWVLPKLDKRAELHIQNQIVPPSKLHFLYVGMELVKIVCLITFGISLFK
ncbi:MAG: hypothetical protein FGM14_13415 [Flavobacteriales bacterium]|nr:hypothetical protein [Flavobacteriales bacterium]